jgi:hypothetical protein
VDKYYENVTNLSATALVDAARNIITPLPNGAKRRPATSV